MLDKTAASIFLGEPLPLWKISAAALVMTGLAIIILVPKFTRTGK